MMKDVIQRGGPVVTISHCTENRYDAAAHIQIPEVGEFAAWGILFIYVAQMTALLKAETPTSPRAWTPTYPCKFFLQGSYALSERNDLKTEGRG